LAMMYGFSTMPSIRAAFLVAAGIICLICFVLFEIKVTYPIVDINLFRHNKVFAYSNLAALINYASTFAVTFLLSLYLQQVEAMTPQYAGLILVTQPVVQALFSPLTGRMSDRIEPRLLASWGMTCTFIGLIMLIFLDAGSALSYILICLMIHGFGFALFSSPNTNAVMGSVERHVYGVASATLSTMRQVGMTLSMGIVMMTMSMLLGTTDITPAHPREFIESMRISFAIFALLCLGGIFASMARGTVNK
jgi:MFS family permease